VELVNQVRDEASRRQTAERMVAERDARDTLEENAVRKLQAAARTHKQRVVYLETRNSIAYEQWLSYYLTQGRYSAAAKMGYKAWPSDDHESEDETWSSTPTEVVDGAVTLLQSHWRGVRTRRAHRVHPRQPRQPRVWSWFGEVVDGFLGAASIDISLNPLGTEPPLKRRPAPQSPMPGPPELKPWYSANEAAIARTNALKV